MHDTCNSVPRSRDGGTLGHIGRIARRNPIMLAFGAAFICLLAFLPDFGTVSNLLGILRQSCIVGAMALGMTVAFSAGEFDMSPAATGSCAGVLAVMIMQSGYGVWWAILAALGFGMSAGLVNGFLVVCLGVNSFIATLGIHFVINGIELVASKGNPLYEGIAPEFLSIARGYVGRVPAPVIIVLCLAVGLWALFRWTLFGRHIQATGGNPVTSFLSGVNVGFYKWACFVVSGLFGTIGGLIMTSRVGSAQTLAGEAILLDVFIAVLLGMSVSSRESASFGSSLLGAVIMVVVANSLALLGVSAYFMSICKGALVLGVLTTSRLLRSR